MNIKVIEINGKASGKTISVLVGIHGNEVPGIKAIEKILPNLEINKGTLYIIYCNLKAIKKNKRFIEQNLNRCFLKKQPREIRNSLEGKTAREIMPYLDKSDIMLDLHTSNSKKTKPFIICEKQSFKIAKALPIKIVSRNWDEFQRGSTDYYMNLQNKIGICAECGYLGDKKSVKFSQKVILEFLKAIGLMNKKQKLNKQKYFEICSLYKNKYGKFKKTREFSDFEFLKKGTSIGMDGNEKVIIKKDRFVLFVRDRNKIGEECFLTTKPAINIKTKENSI